VNAEDVLDFWFEELTPQQWYKKDLELDQIISERFGATLNACGKGELSGWRAALSGHLAEVIVLDQFSRNIYRDQPPSLRMQSPGPCSGTGSNLPLQCDRTTGKQKNISLHAVYAQRVTGCS